MEGVVGLGISCLMVDGVKGRCAAGVVAKREDWNGEGVLLGSVSEGSVQQQLRQ